MCGFAGYIDLTASNRRPAGKDAVTPTLVSMNDAISHRGPDAIGYFEDNYCSIGHARLKVIDLDGGAQPWIDNDKGLCLVFNGEIYNHKELRQQLIEKGYEYRSNSDTETLFFAYQEWGEECVSRLRGMFAFVIWDSQKKAVYGARDRLGLKPLYYYVKDSLLIVASELKALLHHPSVEREIDSDSLVDYLRLGYYPAPRTPLKNVFKLKPASTISFSESGLSINEYWQIEDYYESHKDKPYMEASNQINSLLSDAVDYRLASDVPIGTFLSGGIDSSIITAYSSARTDQELNTYSVKFDYVEYDESQYAQSISRLFNTRHHETDVHSDLKQDIKKILWHMDEPFADDSAIPTYYLCREARKNMTVALSGDGADELFAGYSWHLQLLKNANIVGNLPNAITSLFSHFMPNQYLSNIRGMSFLYNLGQPPSKQHTNLRSIFSDHWISNCLADAPSSFKTHPMLELHEALGQEGDAMGSAIHVDLKLYLAEDILMKVDKMSMAHGLEVRAPFLDHILVEYCLGLPNHYKHDGKVSKKILKDMIKSQLPSSVVSRKKQGFSTPLKQWLLNDLRPLVEHYLLNPENASGVFDSAQVSHLWKQFVKQSRYPLIYVDISHQVWTLLSFEIWYDQFIGGSHKGYTV